MKKIGKIFQKLLIIFLLIILVYVLYSKYIVKDSVTKIFGYGFLVVVTGSMEPEIGEEELIIIKEENEYNVGDIITYENDNYLVTHRIIKINDNEIITKGDANNEEDLKISENQIVGKVIYHSKALGIFVIYYLKIILIIVVILGAIIYFLSLKNKKGDDEIKRE